MEPVFARRQPIWYGRAMIYAVNVANHVREFAGGVAHNWNRVAEIAEDQSWGFSEEAQVVIAGYKRALAAPLLAAGAKMYEMGLDGRMVDPLHQRQVADAIGVALLMADQVDDVADTGQVDEEAREAFFFGGADVLLRGTSDYEPSNTPQQVAYDIAAALRRNVIWDDQHGYFQTALGILVPAALEQFTAPTLTAQLRATVGVGEGTFALASATLLELLAEMELPQDGLAAVDEAIRAFGILAQCLDNADSKEARADQREQYSRTYLRQYLDENGDTPANLQRAREELIDTGLAAYNHARGALSAEQRAILDALHVAVEAVFWAPGYRRQYRPMVHQQIKRLRPAIFG